MEYEKKTSFEQLHTLWIRMWDFMIKFIQSLDGNEVQEAIKAVNDPEHPFFAKLKEALDTLKLKLTCEISQHIWEIKGTNEVNDWLQALRNYSAVDKIFTLGVHFEGIVETRNWREMGAIRLKFLRFNQAVGFEIALEEIRQRNLTIAPLESVAYFINEYSHTPEDERVDLGDMFGHDLVFINPEDLSKSIALYRDSMSGWMALQRDKKYGYAFAVVEKS